MDVNPPLHNFTSVYLHFFFEFRARSRWLRRSTGLGFPNSTANLDLGNSVNKIVLQA